MIHFCLLAPYISGSDPDPSFRGEQKLSHASETIYAVLVQR